MIKNELEKASSEEKVKILENAFRQERFIELGDEQISALSSILEQAKREVSIANQGYKEGKLSTKKNPLVIAVVSIALVLGGLFFINYLQSNPIKQPNPTNYPEQSVDAIA